MSPSTSSISIDPSKTKTKSQRPGRAGKLQCDVCRNAKKGWEVIPYIWAEIYYECEPVDPSNEFAPCKRCTERRIKCDGRKWPKAKADQLQREESYKDSVATLTNVSDTLVGFQEAVLGRLDQLYDKVTKIENRLASVEKHLTSSESRYSDSVG